MFSSLLSFFDRTSFTSVVSSFTDIAIDNYQSNQLWLCIELPFLGKDLEHVEIHSWCEAQDIFWQIVQILATGEEQRQFEHRDLHWGNIMVVKSSTSSITSLSSEKMSVGSESNGDGDQLLTDSMRKLDITKSAEIPQNFKVTLIDFTLSRCRGSNGRALFNNLNNDPEIFKSKGMTRKMCFSSLRGGLLFRCEPAVPRENHLSLCSSIADGYRFRRLSI